MKVRILSIFAVLCFSFGFVPSVFAAPEDPGDGDAISTITLTGGSLSIVIDNMAFTGVTLTGTARTSVPSDLGDPWVATDPTGTGSGWNLMIKATDFSDGTHTIPLDYTYLGGHQYLFDMNVDDVTALDGHNQPSLGTGLAGDMPYIIAGTPDWNSLSGVQTVDQKFIGADEDEGMGKYEIQPDYFLDIPAEMYAGTYTSVMYVTVTAGP